jgi:hypothetical protein
MVLMLPCHWQSDASQPVRGDGVKQVHITGRAGLETAVKVTVVGESNSEVEVRDSSG